MISSTALNFKTSLQLELPQYEKLSQHTLREFTPCKTEKTLGMPAFGSHASELNVRLISKEEEKSNTAEKPSNQRSTSTCLNDCETLSKTELRLHYKREATAHRNMLSRAKSKGAIIHETFRCFKSFLKLVGPMPVKGATLDRVNNNDPEYGPGKVRWADKLTQNNNKSDTATFYSDKSGETYTASRLAKKQSVSAAAIRQRRNRGWSDEEVIDGKRRQAKDTYSVHLPATSTNTKPTVYRKLTAREILYNRMAADFERERALYGTEALPATLDELNEFLSPGNKPVTMEQYERRFVREIWPRSRPHVNFFNALPFHQALIEKIDPEYVAKVRAEKRLAEELRDQL